MYNRLLNGRGATCCSTRALSCELFFFSSVHLRTMHMEIYRYLTLQALVLKDALRLRTTETEHLFYKRDNDSEWRALLA